MTLWVVDYPYLKKSEQFSGWVYLTEEEALNAIKNIKPEMIKKHNIRKNLFKIAPYKMKGTLADSLKITNPELFL